ncbi:MAG TPA: hypothetical protein VGO62_02455, partial [Myxococcota bacterium]
MADQTAIDAGVLEELQQALLEVAARKDALRAWPRESAPDQFPPVQARRDDDGTLGVFRFFTIVEPTGSMVLDPARDMTAEEARAKIDGVDKLKPGDEVGVELPLDRLAAIALADVEAVRAGRTHLLPPRVVEMLGDDALADAVGARLSALRGPPPLVPLRRLVTDFGGDAVEWTAVCARDDQGNFPRHGELAVLVERGDEHKLVVVPTATSSSGHAALLRALAPLPDDRSLWRFLEVEGPKLLCGDEGSLWSEPAARRLSLEVKSIAIARDPTVFGVARAKVRLLTWEDEKIVDEKEATAGLPVDLPRNVDQAWPEGDALARVEAAALHLREAVRARLSDRAKAGGDASVDDMLGGCAFLRVLARAAAGQELGDGGAEPAQLREVSDAPDDGTDDEIGIRVADVGVLVLSPGDDVVKLRTGDDAHELFVDGALCDGDVEAWRAFAATFAHAVVDAEVDVELSLVKDGAEETVLLSSWLASLGERALLTWLPRPGAS